MARWDIHASDCRPRRLLSFPAVSTYDWLLALHLLAAFCFVSGSIATGSFHWAADGDSPSEALHAAVADRTTLALNYASFALVIAILVLMIFKPGAN